MEPLMSFEGYQVIENTDKSRDLLNKYYTDMGFKIVNSNDLQAGQAQGQQPVHDQQAPQR